MENVWIRYSRINKLVTDNAQRLVGVGLLSAKANIESMLKYGTESDNPDTDHRRFCRFVKKDKEIEVTETRITKLFTYLENIGVTNRLSAKEFVTVMCSSDGDVVSLYNGKIGNREIEILSTKIIKLVDDNVVESHVQVLVDETVFLERDDTVCGLKQKRGRHIRISPQGGESGAVTMPVDAERGEVLLVSQFRHPQRSWLNELPRGDALQKDGGDGLKTGLRELLEETGAVPVNTNGQNDAIELRRLFTDTGKLTDEPSYVLAFVSRDVSTTKPSALEPLIYPFWVSLELFYEAVYLGFVKLESDISDLYNTQYDVPQISTRSGRNDILEIQDAFTVTSAILAESYIEERNPALIKKLRAIKKMAVAKNSSFYNM